MDCIATFGKIFTMKIKLLSAIVLISLLTVRCTPPAEKSSIDSMEHDTTIYDITRPIGNNYLEDLLQIKSEAELIAKFTAVRVKYDTIWGAEGEFGFGTYIDKGTKDEVQLIWNDSLRKNGVSSAMAMSYYDISKNVFTYDNIWTSSRGIKVGMTTDELQELNGKSFIFSGFGWDYGGSIIDWKEGKLSTPGLGIALTEGDGANGLSEKDAVQLLGDIEVSSDNPIVKKVKPRIYRISVYRN